MAGLSKKTSLKKRTSTTSRKRFDRNHIEKIITKPQYPATDEELRMVEDSFKPMSEKEAKLYTKLRGSKEVN